MFNALCTFHSILANKVPALTATSGTETVNGDSYLYLDLNSPKIVLLTATDDDTVTFNLVDTTPNAAALTSNNDGTAAMTVTATSVNPIQVR